MAKFDITKIFSPKQKYAESLIRRYAIYSDRIDEVKIAPTASMFDASKLEYISSGINARVFKYPDFNCVVKEGRWDLDIELFKGKRIPLNANIAQKIMKIFFNFWFVIQ